MWERMLFACVCPVCVYFVGVCFVGEGGSSAAGGRLAGAWSRRRLP